MDVHDERDTVSQKRLILVPPSGALCFLIPSPNYFPLLSMNHAGSETHPLEELVLGTTRSGGNPSDGVEYGSRSTGLVLGVQLNSDEQTCSLYLRLD